MPEELLCVADCKKFSTCTIKGTNGRPLRVLNVLIDEIKDEICKDYERDPSLISMRRRSTQT